MDIIVTSTQRVFRRVDDCIALLLMEAFPESFKKYAAPAPAPPPTHPVFGISAGTQGRMGISCIYPNGESRFLLHALGDALPTREAAAIYFGHTAWDPTVGTEGARVMRPLPVPEDVWKRFLAAHGQ